MHKFTSASLKYKKHWQIEQTWVALGSDTLIFCIKHSLLQHACKNHIPYLSFRVNYHLSQTTNLDNIYSNESSNETLTQNYHCTNPELNPQEVLPAASEQDEPDQSKDDVHYPHHSIEL